MDFLKTQLKRIQQQLAGLGATQKMLAAALLVIMVMTLYWWAGFAGKPEMEVVLDQSMTADDIAVITTRLRSQNISYKVVGDRIQVPSDRKMEVLADLGYAQLLPRDTKNGMDNLISRISPFASNRQQEEVWNQLKQTALAQITAPMAQHPAGGRPH